MQIIGRLFDLVCSTVGLVFLAPVLVTIALIIVVTDGRPVLFRQTRVGKSGNVFKVLKFRTMHAGVGGSLVTADGDSRVTKVGITLRKYKLDELPQLFNVLRGEMSVVGPRPEVPNFVELDTPAWQDVLRVRPGITDLATLLYRDEGRLLGSAKNPDMLYRSSILPAKLTLTRAYLSSRSFWQDVRLICLTLYYSVFQRRFDPKSLEKAFIRGVWK